MIKSITAGSGLTISGMYTSNPYISPGANGAGMLRWNPNMGYMEVNDGSTWLQITMSAPTIELAPHVQAMLNWAQTKMAEEAKLTELVNRHPGIQDLKEKLDIMVALVRKENQTE